MRLHVTVVEQFPAVMPTVDVVKTSDLDLSRTPALLGAAGSGPDARSGVGRLRWDGGVRLTRSGSSR